jgi:hypothetical protein
MEKRKKEKPKQSNSFYAYNNLRRRVMKTPNPEEKDWLRLSYEDKMDWINKYGRFLEF